MESLAPGLYIRPMRFSDIPGMASVASEAFYGDEFMHRTLNPYAEDNPLGWRYWVSTRLRARFVAKDSWGFVCCSKSTSPSGHETEEVLGLALWTYRVGGPGGSAVDLQGKPKQDVADPPVQHSNTSFWFAVERFRSKLEGLYNEHPLSPYHFATNDRTPVSSLWPISLLWKSEPTKLVSLELQPAPSSLKSRSAPDSVSALMAEAAANVDDDAQPGAPTPHPAFTTATPFAPLPPHFYLMHLSVSPSAQRQGIGRGLLEYSFENLVAQHHVPAALIASSSGQGLYSSVGFKTVGWMSPPNAGFAGGAAMVWDGTGKWVRAVTAEDKKRAGGKVKVWEREVDGVYVWKEDEQGIMSVPATVEQVESLVVEGTA